MDRFDTMQAFARVVETGSFTKAAETMRVSRTTVTQWVQQLESRLQVKLLSRTTRKVKVTDAGAAFYARVIRLLADVEDAENSVAQAHWLAEGPLRVDVPSPLARMILIPALPAFHARYPRIQVIMRVSDRTVDLLDENVDCVIRGGPISDQSLVAKRLGELRLQTYASPEYVRRAGQPTHPGELEASPHQVVGYLWAHKNQHFPYAMRRGQELVHVRSTHRLAVDDGNAYLAAGVAGLGVVWLPDYMASDAVAQGALVRLLTDWQLDPMPLHAVFHPSRRMSARLEAFVDWTAEHIAALIASKRGDQIE
ncbi:LysR substrate-binding domain-containing protein [Castellaniella hirudinis]|uniref:LysR substrate-binding domain-containing protein n=1 Tax=Castellaniella hirudinis TaxID=1144617 RepID=A0ABV8RZF4_9BURK